MLTGTNLQYAKDFNYRIVLETIRLFGPLSRADIARETSLTAQTVSNIVRRLIDASLVHEGEKRRQGRGAPSVTLKITPEGAYSLGLDLDRDHLTGVLVDLSGKVRQRQHYELSFPSPEEAIPLMVDTAQDLVAAQNIDIEDLSGLGIGFPGPFEIDGDTVVSNVVSPKSFPGWEQVPVVDLIKERLECPVFLKNNATAAAVGERWYGESHPRSTFFYLFFGVGLGGGMVYKGHPYEGFFGNAGEVGYTPTLDAPREDSDRPSHIGEYFNLQQLYDRLEEQGYSASRPSDLASLHGQGAPPLKAWMQTVLPHLTRLVLSIEYLIDPEVIYFGGRLPTPLIQDLMDDLKERLPSLRISGKAEVPALKPATAGKDAAALGVATLPLYEFFAPAPSLLQKKRRNGQPGTE